uniref:glucose-induced degradation protein 8-B homolog isoform X2 n=1 Tax=Erigeron canadensis TaxID=72917 RepID=UPI001CB973E1|nr:glucose-induced degradation protein 8-B homolog isoform X2 [Erigeron canadensis]
MDADPRQYEQIKINEKDSHNIILSYLIHACYKDTVESLATSAGLEVSATRLEDMDKRRRILQLALEGNALEAITLTEKVSPELLQNNKDLHLDLLSLHFIELIRLEKCTEALEFAREKLAPFGKMPNYVEKIEDFMALLAYEEPDTSPMFHLLSPEYRQNVVDSLNRSILAMPSYSELERLIQQATVVRQCLSEELGKDVLSPFSLNDFLKS